MKKQIAVAVALLVAAIAAGKCYAQQISFKADIPFAFQVGNKAMPAGEYLVQHVPSANESAQMIRRTDSSAAALALTFEVGSKNGKSEPELVFHKYGNSYFLSEIWTGQGEGRQLPKSEREKELARETRESEVAVSLQPVSERGL
jgi:hypothetical protein